ncbi:MAG TPA: protein phosphatase 2C domain-containing protein [Sandaracinaceae bacterium]
MTLWIIAGVALLVLVAALAYLKWRRDDDDGWQRPRYEWDRPTNPDVLASIPPPAGLAPPTTFSQEADSIALESQELWIEDDEPTGPIPKILLRAAGRSDPGRKRKHNEDAFLLAPEHELYVVADGMGGYAAGEVASALAVETLAEAFADNEFGPLDEGMPRRGAELVAAIRLANARIRREALSDQRKAGMGTTVVAARFAPGKKRVYVAHVGDSRCYRLRDGELERLTHDHTLGALGIRGPSAAKLSRAVGAFDEVEVDLRVDEPRVGDHYVLCSDGLYKAVDDDAIRRAIEAAAAPEDAVDALVREANARGARDNVSVIVVRVDDPAVDVRESGEHRISG